MAYNVIITGTSVQLHNGQVRINNTYIKWTYLRVIRVTRPPVWRPPRQEPLFLTLSMPLLECPQIYPFLSLNIEVRPKLTLPVNIVGGLYSIYRILNDKV